MIRRMAVVMATSRVARMHSAGSSMEASYTTWISRGWVVSTCTPYAVYYLESSNKTGMHEP
jgi:hypothetical protein